MKLEALPALHGDSLLLHYGTKSKPLLIVIDGGPKTVYAQHLRPRLEELKAERSPDAPLPVRLVMVSHIDEDHILGILNLADELAEDPNEPLVAVQELWHNAFTDILGDEDDTMLKNAGGAARQASVAQGKRLHSAARGLGWVLNDERPLLMAGTDNDTIDAGGKLKLTIVGPSRDRLIALQKDWMKAVAKAKAKEEGAEAKLVEYVDRSAPNLASLIVMVSEGKRRMLLTGDGRGDYILEGLENAGLITNDRCAVNVLKVPHHGSIRDLDDDFFERIPAKDYVISANGRFLNPDIEVLEMIVRARGNAAYDIHLTYPVDEFVDPYDRKALQALIDQSAKKKYKIIPRPVDAKSVVV